jgi:5-(carboxyamino)imidazole ribonucleotide synthase
MLVRADQERLHHFLILDPDPECPAVQAGGQHVPGNPATGEGFSCLAEQSDVVSIDLENICVDELSRLAREGTFVLPQTELLSKIVDKFEQKKLLLALGIPTADFVACDGTLPIEESPFGFPVVQKAARGGYDGRGVQVLTSLDDNAIRLQVPGYLERYIERKMELSVIVAANIQGDVRAYQPVEMRFHEAENVLDFLVAPARIDKELAQSVEELAISTISAMGGVGIFGVEMFLTEDDQLLINEISPRTHNSGHFTTEACETSQFTQQLRILTGQPLGDVAQNEAAVMFNILGEDGFEGATLVEQAGELSSYKGVTIHLYGKTRCFPGRKMGHVTVLNHDIDAAINTVAEIRGKVIVRGENPIEN